MPVKGQHTTSEYIEWHQFQTLLRQLERDKKYRDKLLLTIGCYWGLRISQALELTWKDILNKDKVFLPPHKRGKARNIEIIDDVKQSIYELYKNLNVRDKNEHLMLNRFGRKMSNQYVNKRLKKIMLQYHIPIEKVSSHSMRKTFGRRIWEKAGRSEEALILLSEIFGHISIAVTRRYIGITENEIKAAYHLLAD